MKKYYAEPSMKANLMDSETIIALSGGETPIGGETDEFDVKEKPLFEESPFE
ncbi:MAG: hypothetical protein J5545_04705 [Bacteroidaceae bacterium]|nr:hypothetical protein [Bacteroidaceae bacterium]